MSDNINRKLFYAAQLFNAASGGRYDEVAACISRGADPAWTHRDCWSALHQAAQHGHVQVESQSRILEFRMNPGNQD